MQRVVSMINKYMCVTFIDRRIKVHMSTSFTFSLQHYVDFGTWSNI